MGNCHEADTSLIGMYMEEKKDHVIYIVHRNAEDMERGTPKQAFTFKEEAELFASQYPDALIQKVNLIYNTTNKFYAGDDPL